MSRSVAFLRAINVGGHVVKMDRLCALLGSVGLADVTSFIASGNILFESKKGAAQVEALVETTLKAALGYEVTTMVRSASEVSAIVDHVDAEQLADGAGVVLYVGVLKTAPSPESRRWVAALSTDVDTLVVHGRELYWRCNKRFSDSTIKAPQLGKALGVPMTTRNINTLRRLAARLPPP